MPKYPGVPPLVTRRLPRYYRYLSTLLQNGTERISSREFAEIIGFTASQIRQDLNCFGGFGQQGYGYNVASLHAEIGRILAVDKGLPAILLGVGNLGLALANHIDFEECGFKLIGIFDVNPTVIGQTVNHLTVLDSAELEAFCAKNKPVTAVLCVPPSAVPDLAATLTELGIRSFWNFSQYELSQLYPDKIVVEDVQLRDSLMTLSYQVNEILYE